MFEVGRVGDEYFLALEYVEGRDLRRTLAYLGQHKQRLPVDLALFVGRELANGLAYAHRRTSNDGASLDLVHCDISPPNVLVSFEGETKVIDFGIAKSALRGTATDPKMGFGKFGYMAPEQLIRGGVVDHRTDIYAAGVVLYELLTGKRLYEAGPEPDYRALAKKVAKGEHELPSDFDRALAPYDDLVATALRPKAEDRYQTAAEFRDAIQQCLVSVNPTISTDQLGAFMRELFAEEMTDAERAPRSDREGAPRGLPGPAHDPDRHDGVVRVREHAAAGTAERPAAAPRAARRPGTRSRRPPTAARPTCSCSNPGSRHRCRPRRSRPRRSGSPTAPACFPMACSCSPTSGAARASRAIAIGAFAVVLVVGVVVYAMIRGGARTNEAPVAAKVDPPRHVTVESLPPDRDRRSSHP